MNVKDVRDLAIAQYKVECIKAKPPITPIDFQDKLIYFWISQAKSDILQRLKISKTFIDLSLPIGENVFSLPHDFGSPISCECGGIPLKKVSVDDIKTTGSGISGLPERYAIFNDGEGLQILFNPDVSSVTTVRMWYNLAQGFYSPKRDGSTPKYDLDLPDVYITPIIYFFLEQSIGGFLPKYENEIRKLKALNPNSANNVLEYSMALKQ